MTIAGAGGDGVEVRQELIQQGFYSGDLVFLMKTKGYFKMPESNKQEYYKKETSQSFCNRAAFHFESNRPNL